MSTLSYVSDNMRDFIKSTIGVQIYEGVTALVYVSACLLHTKSSDPPIFQSGHGSLEKLNSKVMATL